MTTQFKVGDIVKTTTGCRVFIISNLYYRDNELMAEGKMYMAGFASVNCKRLVKTDTVELFEYRTSMNKLSIKQGDEVRVNDDGRIGFVRIMMGSTACLVDFRDTITPTDYFTLDELEKINE